MKFCPRCQTEKPITEFYKRSAVRSGLAYICKDCHFLPPKRTRAERENLEITGLRFGSLVAIERDGRDKWGKVMWLCQCDCGGQKRIPATEIIRGKTVSCGCVFRLRTTPHEDGNIKRVLKDYRTNARRRGYEWSLTKEQALSLFAENCFYCGQPPNNIQKSNGVDSFIHNGIDRLDSQIGYIKDNCVSCCTRCNYSKGVMPVEEFLKFISSVYDNLVKSGMIKTI